MNDAQTGHFERAETEARYDAELNSDDERSAVGVRVAAIAPEGPALPAEGVEPAGCDCDAVPGPHGVHCDGCSAPAEACVCASETVAVVLTRRFYDDHVERDLPAGTVLAQNPRTVRVELDRAAYDELLDDARHYADPESGFGPEFAGLVASARTTVGRLQAVGRPGEDLVSNVTAEDLVVAAERADGTAADLLDRTLAATRARLAREELPVDDDPREEPAPVEWSEHAAPSVARPVELPRAVRYGR